MNYDLNTIPKKFHCLFTDSTWNHGNDSEVSSLQRSDFNSLMLEYNKWSIQQAIQKKKPMDEPIQGGFDDLDLFS
jgi:hypothetical protein